MRIIFINFHEVNFLCRTLSQIKSGNKVHTFKHRFIVDKAMQSNVEICDYVFSNRKHGIKGKIIRLVYPGYDKHRAKYVIKKNHFEKEIKLICDKNEISKSDIVIGYFHEPYQRDIIGSFPGSKILMGNHFIRLDSSFSFAGTGISAFVNEIDLTNNEFINRYFDMGNTEHMVCPYAFEPRFEIRREFEDRKNKMMAIGTLSTVEGATGYGLYLEFAGTPWVQPMRKLLLDNANKYPQFFDSYISYIKEDQKKINEDDNKIIRFFKNSYNKKVKWKQAKYTSFDMVEKFNEYRMFICPEELVGMPGIGFVEGMACGCAYVGLNHKMYSDLGLIPGKHYIAYDGTLEDLLSKVEYYQDHENECEEIAREGTKYVREMFNQDKVAGDFLRKLKLISDENG